MENTFMFFVLGVVVLVALILFIFFVNFFGIWLRAKLAGAPVSFPQLLGMRLRRVPVGLVVDCRITALKAGLPVETDLLEAHYLAGGNVDQVILALIAADKAGITLDFNRACAIDLAIKGTTKTVLEAVRTSINPKVIDCPSPTANRITLEAVARDGIGVKVRARVTVRSNLDRFVGGATEETIIARVGEGIVTSIGSAVSYKDVLENPDRISKVVRSAAHTRRPQLLEDERIRGSLRRRARLHSLWGSPQSVSRMRSIHRATRGSDGAYSDHRHGICGKKHALRHECARSMAQPRRGWQRPQLGKGRLSGNVALCDRRRIRELPLGR